MKEGSINDRVTQAALQGLAGKLGESPLARMGIRYWWVSVPIGFAMYGQYSKRKKKDEANLFHLLQDLGSIIGPVAGVIALNEIATKAEEKRFSGPIKDAQFTEVQKNT